MGRIDVVKDEAKEFYDKYSKELNNKEIFHKESEKFAEKKKEPKINDQLP